MSDDNSTAKRFGSADDATIDEFMGDVLSLNVNTKKSTKYAVKMLYGYCSSKGYDTEFEGKTTTVLNNLLK